MIIRNKLRPFGSTSGRFAAWIILAFSIALFLSLKIIGLLVGTVMIAICLFMITASDGIEVNVEQQIFRKTTNCYGLHFGTWNSIPDLTKISVLETTDSIYATSGYNTMSGTKRVYVLRLHPKKGELIIIGRYPGHSKATKDGEYIAQQLGLELQQQKR